MTSEKRPPLLIVEDDLALQKQIKWSLDRFESVAPCNAAVLLLGESGTGKEVLGQAPHQAAKRGRKFIAINCAAIPENLLESELFGYEKGAFTGASKSTIGKIETANGGTLML